MGFCFMTTEKIKSLGTLSSKYNHNYREVDVKNADGSFGRNKDELIKLEDRFGQRLTYNEAWQKKIENLPYYKNHSIRKNQVLAVEVVTTFSRGENVDLEAWKDANVKWLKDTFGTSPDGESNVISVVYHDDEAGNVHCHAIVVPIDERGHLNAYKWLGGVRKLSDLQTSYANEMAQFGLERGIEGSSATHKDIRKYYAELNQAIHNIDMPMPGETATEFRERQFENIGIARAAAKREVDQMKIEGRREIDRQRSYVNDDYYKKQEELEEKRRELIRSKQKAERELNEAAEQILKNKQRLNLDIEQFKKESNRLSKLQDVLDDSAVDELIRAKTFYDALEYAYSSALSFDSEAAHVIKKVIDYVSQYMEDDEQYIEEYEKLYNDTMQRLADIDADDER